MSLNINQFSISPVQGQVDMAFLNNVIAGQVDVSSGGNLVAGQSVKMVDSSGGLPKFVECAADTDDVYGFIMYDIKSAAFNAYDKIQVVCMMNSVLYMTASAAIARNAKVMVVISGSKVATATSGKTIVGRALDKAAADGDLIRVTTTLSLGATA